MTHQTKMKASDNPPPRRSRRTNSTSHIHDLACHILDLSLAEKHHHHQKTPKQKHDQQQHSKKRNKIIIFTGAGLSVPSGIKPFRGPNGVWNQTLWTNATRNHFRKDPLTFYNNFWLKQFENSNASSIPYSSSSTISSSSLSMIPSKFKPNVGHEAIASIAKLFENVVVITQNIDGLHLQTNVQWDWNNRLVECHGRLGLYKCIPNDDSDTSDDETDSSSSEFEEDDDNEVEDNVCDHHGPNNGTSDDSIISNSNLNIPEHKSYTHPRRKRVRIGSRRKQKNWMDRFEKYTMTKTVPTTMTGKGKRTKYQPCIYEMKDSIKSYQLEPLHVRQLLSNGHNHFHNDSCYDNNINDRDERILHSQTLLSTTTTNTTTPLPTIKRSSINSIYNGGDIDDPKYDVKNEPTDLNNKMKKRKENPNDSADIQSKQPFFSITANTITSSSSLSSTSSSSSSSVENSTVTTSTLSASSPSPYRSKLRSSIQPPRPKNGILKGNNKLSTLSNKKEKPNTNNINKKHTESKIHETIHLPTPPQCPSCHRPCLPQALLFDEAYHTHSFYQFEKVEEWLQDSNLLLFVGTSFSVSITNVALAYARDYHIPIYNFNLEKSYVFPTEVPGEQPNGVRKRSNSSLDTRKNVRDDDNDDDDDDDNVTDGNTRNNDDNKMNKMGNSFHDIVNIVGDVTITLPMLWKAICEESEKRKISVK